MKRILITAILLSIEIAWADDVYFDDGRTCVRCKVVSSGGYVESVIDRGGKNWEIAPGQRIILDKYPVLRRMGQASAVSLQQWGANMQQNSQQQMNYLRQQQLINQAKQQNCTTQFVGGMAYTNCY